METSDRRVLVIGLDGATFDLIKPWIGRGKLPNLAKLIREDRLRALGYLD